MSAIAGTSSLPRPGVAARASRPLGGAVAAPLSLVRDPLRITLFVLTILTISRVHEHYPVLAKSRPALFLVIASIGYAYLNPRYLTRTNVLKLWPMRLVAALGVLACCSAAFGISLGGSASFILDSYVKTLAYAFSDRGEYPARPGSVHIRLGVRHQLRHPFILLDLCFWNVQGK